MKNSVQVYGLPKSGTNFLEWTLMEYFKNFNYNNFYKNCDVKGLNKYNLNIAVKHSYPSFEFSDKIIVIYREYDKWNKSYSNWSSGVSGTREGGSIKLWKNYLNKSRELEGSNCIIISHHELYTNYKDSINLFSKKLNLELNNKKIILPKNHLTKGGGNTKQQSNKIYKHE